MMVKERAETEAYKYTELYDFAPAGYFTLSKEGEILQLNIFGATLLGKERSQLLQLRFGFFVSEDTRTEFNLFLEKIFYNNAAKYCELILIRGNKERLTVQLAGVVSDEGGKCLITVSDLTERKQAEEALRKSEENFRSMFRDHSAVMMIVDPKNGIILDANISAANYYGYDRWTLCSMNISEINCMPEDQLRAERQNAFELRNNYFVFNHRLSTGNIRSVEVHSSPIEFQGKYVLFSVIHDITDRISAEERRQEITDRLLKIADRVPGVVYQYRLRPDGSSNFPFASRAINDIYRVSPEEVMEDASAVFANIHPDDLAGVVSSIQRSADELTEWKHEYRVQFPDGTSKHLYGNSLPQREVDGSILWHGFITDISERKHTEMLLENEHLRLQGIIEGTNVGTWEWNIQTGETIFNNKYFEMIGYLPEELFPVSIHSWETLVHPDDLKRSQKFLEQHFKGERLYYTCECRMRHKDGTWVWILDRGRVITRSADGKPLMMFGTHTDITLQKNNEEERERLIAALQSALADVKTLTGIIPICANCKKIRDDKGYWEQVESYVSHHTNAQFSHSVCPDCVEKLYPKQAERLRNRPKE
jgi:PAS domain S-box-containing protein